MNCRSCNTILKTEFADLGFSPPSNSFLKPSELIRPETYYPLKIMVCDHCFLVQVDEFAKHHEIFNEDYAYFSSYSTSWLAHAKNYVDQMVERFKLDHHSSVIEVASNDGYLLQYFHEKNIPTLGIEPTKNTAEVAISKGINTVIDFFGTSLAKKMIAQHIQADLLLGNNVLAHVPDINDFVQGLKLVLKPKGIITLEFPHLLQLILQNQFDTIYHEHFSYLSLIALESIFKRYNLELFDAEELSTHGGSLRIYLKHAENQEQLVSDRVAKIKNKEIQIGLNSIDSYIHFQDKINKAKDDLVQFLIECKAQNKIVLGYGAAAKGNTFLNFAGIRKDLIPYIVDASPHKQGKFTPGVHIPVVHEDKIKEIKPDYILVLPWNLKEEIIKQLDYTRKWNLKFVTAIPQLTII